jgi:hypothetical protein
MRLGNTAGAEGAEVMHAAETGGSFASAGGSPRTANFSSAPPSRNLTKS